MNKKSIVIAISSLLIMFLLFIIFFYLMNKDNNKLELNDYISNSNLYITDLSNRLGEVNYGEEISSVDIKKKLNFIDTMYNDGLINASERTYYLPDEPCNKDTCFSVRETYLFNFNYTLYEG